MKRIERPLFYADELECHLTFLRSHKQVRADCGPFSRMMWWVSSPRVLLTSARTRFSFCCPPAPCSSALQSFFGLRLRSCGILGGTVPPFLVQLFSDALSALFDLMRHSVAGLEDLHATLLAFPALALVW